MEVRAMELTEVIEVQTVTKIPLCTSCGEAPAEWVYVETVEGEVITNHLCDECRMNCFVMASQCVQLVGVSDA
jgi:hypothetical protein